MHYLRGWAALQNDPKWMSKVGWASLLFMTAMCIPIVGQLVVIGWNALMLRRAVSGQDSPLPRMEFDFDYLGKLLGTGFKGYLAQLLWSLPMVAVMMVGLCCIYAGMAFAGVGVVAGAEAGGEAGAGVGAVLGLLLMVAMFVFLFVVMLVFSMVVQVAVMRAEITDDLNAAMRFGEVIAMTKLLGKELLIGLFVVQAMGMGFFIIGLASLYILLAPSLVIFQIIVTYFRAELYRVYLEKGGEPLPIGPLAVEGGDAPTIGQQPYSTAPAQF